jgi:hypothetical protein
VPATVCYRVNTAKATHQTIDGEVVILNLERGHYYSLAGSATVIWSGVERNLTIDQIASELGRRYDGDRQELEREVGRFLEELRAEDLVVAESAPGQEAPRSGPVAEGMSGEPRQAFESPSLEKYTELEDLLLLDPVHQVDESGWPTAGGR